MKKRMMGITAFTVLGLSACSTTSPTTDSGQQEEQGAVAQEIQVPYQPLIADNTRMSIVPI